ncbi:hypothetical protein CHH55_16315 [Niallia circulans]|jgi:hypothetical protein|nr:hypothetical protein CHH62_07650 [Niallia circulans]PAD86762.1 hypothetical protein CHH55_16315 [Niallia circulans]
MIALDQLVPDAKEKHGIRWTPLKGHKKLSMQTLFTCGSVNLKKMAN